MPVGIEAAGAHHPQEAAVPPQTCGVCHATSHSRTCSGDSCKAGMSMVSLAPLQGPARTRPAAARPGPSGGADRRPTRRSPARARATDDPPVRRPAQKHAGRVVTTESDEVEPTGWRLTRELSVAFWREMRAGPQPLPVLYIACDGCGQVTPRTKIQKIMSISEGQFTGSPPETVCEACDHAQPRIVNDEVPADSTVVCTGRRFRRFGFKRRRKPCGDSFTVPATAVLVKRVSPRRPQRRPLRRRPHRWTGCLPVVRSAASGPAARRWP